MKYIGNKTRLIDFIEKCLEDSEVDFHSKRVLDLFAGTGAVSLFFKSNDCSVTSVDFMTFSICNLYYFNRFPEEPSFAEIETLTNSKDFKSVFNWLLNTKNPRESYYFTNYAPSGSFARQYFTDKNAKLMDNYFNNLEVVKNLLPSEKYLFLVGAGINAFDRVANIAGTYGAYLKIWRSMALKDVIPVDVPYVSCGSNEIIKEDVISYLTKKMHYDIVYMDPPYNERQYAPNFHVLENLACNDKPKLSGKTGVRPYENQISKFCSKKEAIIEFSKLVSLLDTDVFVLSYSTEGIMNLESIKLILENKFNKVDVYKKDYRRFKTNTWTEKQTNLKEVLFVCKSF